MGLSFWAFYQHWTHSLNTTQSRSAKQDLFTHTLFCWFHAYSSSQPASTESTVNHTWPHFWPGTYTAGLVVFYRYGVHRGTVSQSTVFPHVDTRNVWFLILECTRWWVSSKSFSNIYDTLCLCSRKLLTLVEKLCLLVNSEHKHPKPFTTAPKMLFQNVTYCSIKQYYKGVLRVMLFKSACYDNIVNIE